MGSLPWHGSCLTHAMSAISPIRSNGYAEGVEISKRAPASPGPVAPTPGSLPGQSLSFSLRRVQLALQRGGLREMSEGRVGQAEFGVLSHCAAQPGVAQVQIATALDVDKASVVGLVDRLEALGWLIRRRNPKDRRRHGLHLTGEGARALQELQQQAGTIEARVRGRFTEVEWEQFLGFLARAGGA
jgi:DNA-binding MarR family transcriptional regulator